MNQSRNLTPFQLILSAYLSFEIFHHERINERKIGCNIIKLTLADQFPKIFVISLLFLRKRNIRSERQRRNYSLSLGCASSVNIQFMFQEPPMHVHIWVTNNFLSLNYLNMTWKEKLIFHQVHFHLLFTQLFLSLSNT